jgi:hypothetical protein
MSVVLDAGALISIDRNERLVMSMLKRAFELDVPVVTSAGAVGQVWRGGARQASLARALRGIRIHELDARSARDIGHLLAVSESSDVIDAHVAIIARVSDLVVTSDVDDISHLMSCAGIHADIMRPSEA